jgi:hypothetical protein
VLADGFFLSGPNSKIDMVLSHPDRMAALGIKARETVLKTSFKHSIKNYERMLKCLGVALIESSLVNHSLSARVIRH